MALWNSTAHGLVAASYEQPESRGTAVSGHGGMEAVHEARRVVLRIRVFKYPSCMHDANHVQHHLL